MTKVPQKLVGIISRDHHSTQASSGVQVNVGHFHLENNTTNKTKIRITLPAVIVALVAVVEAFIGWFFVKLATTDQELLLSLLSLLLD